MRRRPPLANRLRDERGGPRRDDDRGNKRRAEGSPTREGDEAEAKNGDDPMFDAFGGRGPRGGGGPFLAEFPPPPILMPVPGAGYAIYTPSFLFCFFLWQGKNSCH